MMENLIRRDSSFWLSSDPLIAIDASYKFPPVMSLPAMSLGLMSVPAERVGQGGGGGGGRDKGEVGGFQH